MNPVLDWLASESWARVVQALLHTLWIGALAAGGLALVLRRATDPRQRYRWCVSALGGVLLGGLAAWALMQEEPARASAPMEATSSSYTEVRTAAAGPVAVVERNAAFQPVRSAAPIVPVENWRSAAASWTPWLAMVWLAGAALMLLRSLWLVAGAEKLRRESKPLTDEVILKLVEEARRQLKLARRIQVAVTDRLTSPAVMGVVAPTLLVPLSMMTTMSMEQLQLVFLHELAHIRRGDYLANLCQLLAESLLFFNPAVWWISRQVRQEREACCDALAIALAGGRVEYAKALAQTAESALGLSAATIGFAAEGGPSGLKDRIQRLLVPGYRPGTPWTWRAMLGALALGLAMLTFLGLGARWTVQKLSPRQRIAQIEKVLKDYGKPANEKQDDQTQIEVRAQILTKDGSPLPADATGVFWSGKQGGSTSVGAYHDSRDPWGFFKSHLSRGDLFFICNRAPGFAPALIGPLDIRLSNRVDLVLTLDRGFDLGAQAVDADSGRELEGAVVKAAVTTVAGPVPLEIEPAVGPGQFAIHHCAALPVELTVDAPGYETTKVNFKTFQPGETLKVKTRRALVTTGIVLDKVTQRGIAGAMLYSMDAGWMGAFNPINDLGRPLATSDASGRFAIDSLARSAGHLLLAWAPGHERVFVQNAAAGQTNLVVSLEPELIVRGKIIGATDILDPDRSNRKLMIMHHYMLNNSGYSFGVTPEQKMEGDVLSFVFTNDMASRVSISLKGRSFEKLVDQPVEDWEIDLTSPAEEEPPVKMRTVIFHFDTASSVPPRGTMVATVPIRPPNNARQVEVGITNGEVRVETIVGRMLEWEPSQTVGYWFERGFTNAIPDGPGPVVIHLAAVPAGAIYGRALDADGSPARDVRFSVYEETRSPLIKGVWGYQQPNDSSAYGDGPRNFVANAVPLGGTYLVIAQKGNRFQASPLIRLTEEKPTEPFELKFTDGKSGDGQVLGTNGLPLASTPVSLEWGYQSHSFGTVSVKTDIEGRFHFDDLTTGLGKYTVNVRALGCLTEIAPFQPGSLPVTIKLKPGLKLSGRVLEEKSGRAIVDVEVRTISSGGGGRMETTRTDDAGHFEFSTLAKGEYSIYVDSAYQDQSQRQVYSAGQSSPVLLRVKPYQGSQLRLAEK